MKCSKSSVLFLILGVTTVGCSNVDISKDAISTQIAPTELTIPSIGEVPANLTDPKIFSVQKAKVESLSSSAQRRNSTGGDNPANDKNPRPRPVQINAYTAEAEPEIIVSEKKKPIKFSRLISKEPTKITVSLFEETKRKPNPSLVSSGTTTSFSYPPVFSKLVIPLPEELENQVLITDFEPMRMVESQAKLLKGGVLHEIHPQIQAQPEMLHYFQPNPDANYQYFSQGPPQPPSQPAVPEVHEYYPTEEVVVPAAAPAPQLQENEVQVEVEPQPQPHPQHLSLMTAPSPLPSPQYNFAYRVHDSRTGTNHGHTEFRSGGVVHGRYAVMDPDGLLRTVSYTSHPVHGFNAVVNRQPPGGHFANAIVSPVNSGAFYGSRTHPRHGHGYPGYFSSSYRL